MPCINSGVSGENSFAGGIGIAQHQEEGAEELISGDGLRLFPGNGNPALVHEGINGIAGIVPDAGEGQQEFIGNGSLSRFFIQTVGDLIAAVHEVQGNQGIRGLNGFTLLSGCGGHDGNQ